MVIVARLGARGCVALAVVALVAVSMLGCEEVERVPLNYVCPNGAATVGDAIAPGVTSCTACNDGYRLIEGACVVNAFTCENGTPKPGFAQSAEDTNCTACNDGYRLEGIDCIGDIYTCINGIPAREVASGGVAGENRCESCDGGYELEGIECVVITYLCPNGTPVSQVILEGIPGETRCASCDGDFVLDKNNACDVDVDDDDDGLIEISSLEELYNIRYNLKGSSYKTSADDEGATGGGPTVPTVHCPAPNEGAFLCGYELTGDLDFDTDGDGTYTGTRPSVTLDSDDNSADNVPPYFDAAAGGWVPIGTDEEGERFSAIFDGNGYSISNLTARSDLTGLGLFGAIDDGANIRNLGVVDVLLVKTGSSAGSVGGIVGRMHDGFITASYAIGHVYGGASATDFEYVGGLAGRQDGNTRITASYARVDAYGGAGLRDSVGGLVGYQDGGLIIASYASGAVDGGAGVDNAGGLVGEQGGSPSIIASYASGAVNGGTGADNIGSLVGNTGDASVIIGASFGFGARGGGGGDASGSSPLPDGATAATGLSPENAGSCDIASAHRTRSGCVAASAPWFDWNRHAGGVNAWIFGDDSNGSCAAPASGATSGVDYPGFATRSACESTMDAMNAVRAAGVWTPSAPKLQYADYDGGGGDFRCAQFPIALITCGAPGPALLGQ